MSEFEKNCDGIIAVDFNKNCCRDELSSEVLQ